MRVRSRTRIDLTHGRFPLSSIENFRQNSVDVFGLGPRMELPRFDGTNPKLWQTRCEDYFRLWNTPSSLWISYATSLFEGAAASWLESVHRRVPQINWEEFCRLLQSRFGRNLHQAILRKFFSICQTGSISVVVFPCNKTSGSRAAHPFHFPTLVQVALENGHSQNRCTEDSRYLFHREQKYLFSHPLRWRRSLHHNLT